MSATTVYSKCDPQPQTLTTKSAIALFTLLSLLATLSILQRTSVNKGQLKIQGVATCLYLCMDSCGLLYGSKEFTKDCIFNEIFEQHHYNTYTSARYSDGRRTLYVALNKRGLPRKVQVRAGAPLRRLSTYTRTLTKPAPQAAVDRLLAAAAAAAAAGSEPQPTAHPLRHHAHHQLCPVSRAPAPPPDDAAADGDADGRDKTRCRRRRKRKKRKRRCREGEPEGEDCQGRGKGQARRPAKGGKAR
ncbi:uncharacterized protein LOC126249378, partial [Schistocerca nitens]|uniref:uncharacterized protein LOC126249378 n=1 Tax=Schistocerca nitens TaxID=7011 RepID=UPI0021191652